MASLAKQPEPAGLVVYGLGSVGKGIVDDLLAEGVPVDFILDRGKRGESYRGIPVLALYDVADGGLAGREVLIGLHNHYVDIKQIHARALRCRCSARVVAGQPGRPCAQREDAAGLLARQGLRLREPCGGFRARAQPSGRPGQP